MSILGQNRKAKFIGEDMHEAYTAFYNRYYSFMYERAKYKLNGKSHTAQDVVQTCMIEISKEKVFNLLMNLEERVVRSYVISMVDNCVIDYYRSQKIYKLEPIDDLKKYEDKSNSLKKDVLKKVCKKEISIDYLTEDDFRFNAPQKGVDMRIGLDIASLSYKKQVNQIILISDDSDFVPAAKLARREGVDFILDPMGAKMKANLFEHIDGIETPKVHFKTTITEKAEN